MPVTINVNGLSLCHRGSDGISVATAPDVCLTPPGVPVPYPNIAYSADLAGGTGTVFADGGNSIAHRPSIFATSTGDEPGTMGGVVSGTFMKEASWLTFSADVKIEGHAACRLTDKMLHNHGNTFNCAGEQQPPVGGNADCAAMWKQVRKEVDDVLRRGGDRNPILRNKHITAAYAKIYREHPELKWAGMGAFVSKEAGCGMKEAVELYRDNLGLGEVKAGIREAARAVLRGLAAGNKAIFRDIYPQFLFYAKYGNDALQRCAAAGGMTPEMKQAFNLFAKGDKASIEKATLLVATQEQAVTLQNVMKNDPLFVSALIGNKVGNDLVVGRLFGAKNPDVYLSASCGGGPKVPFNGNIIDVQDRIDMAIRVSQAFDKLQEKWPKWMSVEFLKLEGKQVLTSSPPNYPVPPVGTVLP
ncbi:DUF4150 domain-containing protein [Sorangium sp. So ce426]|uniref:DUF4150 domain-containing protein n=1 Tax=unclassified Sorangium TaxID=2621164 RepID=UPI003F5C6307